MSGENPVEQHLDVDGDGNTIYMAAGDLTIHAKAPEPEVRSFDNVWYVPRRLRLWEPVNADIGTLLVYRDHLEFEGEKGRLTLAGVREVKHTRHGGDISNSWVRLLYGDPATPREAWFSRRTRLGVDALLGGSGDLFSLLHRRFTRSAG